MGLVAHYLIAGYSYLHDSPSGIHPEEDDFKRY